jgi:hypothetical protein
VESITLLVNRILAGLLLISVTIGLANATPNVQSVFPSYDATGNPVNLDVLGAGFTCPSCGALRVRIAGVLSTSVTVNSATELHVGIAGLPPGDYKLRVTVMPNDDDLNASVFDFTLGAEGPQGAQGIQGPQGIAGIAGMTGATGPAGPAGPQGVPGPIGPAGATGPVGSQGPKGDMGATGPQGPAGPAGPAGAAGASGASVPTCTTPNISLVLFNGALVCQAEYADNGDGTVTDNKTGLMWEQATGTVGATPTSDVRDVNALYGWSSSGTLADGTLFTTFLATLNGGDYYSPSDGLDVSAGPGSCFANHCDWRIPTLVELQSILLDAYSSSCATPCIDPTFGPSPTLPYYWSSSSFAGKPIWAWGVNFNPGGRFYTTKTSNVLSARAVRNGR